MELIPLWREQGPATSFFADSLLAFQRLLPSFHLLPNPFNGCHTFPLPTPRTAFAQRYQHGAKATYHVRDERGDHWRRG